MRAGARRNAGKRLKGSLSGPSQRKPGRLAPFDAYMPDEDYLMRLSAEELAYMGTTSAIEELRRRHRDSDGIKFVWKESGRLSQNYTVKKGRSR